MTNNKYNHIDLTQGSIIKNILHASWPLTIAFFIHTLYHLVDTIFVGKISPEAIAALAVAFPVMFFMFAVGGGISSGISSYIARLYGAKKYDKASIAAEHAIIIAVTLAIIFTISGLFFSNKLFSFIIQDNLLFLTLEYMNVIFIGSIFILLYVIANGILRGTGDMKTPMKAMIFSALLNIILDPIFIFTFNLGVKGAAIATIISMFSGMLWILIHLFKDKSSVILNFKIFKFDFIIIKEILRVGLPTSFANMGTSIGLFIINKIVAIFGPLAIAAFGIGFRLESVAILPAIGIMMATTTIVGQNVGSKKIKRAEKTTIYAGYLSFLFALILALIYISFPQAITSIFTKDPQVIALTTSYLRIVSLSFMFVAFSMAIVGGFLGAGKPIPALMINLTRILLLALPFAYLFAITFNIGINGIWYGISIAYILTTIFAFVWFKSGTWKKNIHVT